PRRDDDRDSPAPGAEGADGRQHLPRPRSGVGKELVAMSNKTYTAICERTADWWTITVDPEPNRHVITQARRLGQVEETARDAIALLLGTPAESFDIVVEVRLPPSVRRLLDRAVDLRREAALAS